MNATTLQEGMTWSAVFTVLNQLITEFVALQSAVGGALVNGQFDYTALANKPQINGIELDGNKAHETLLVDIGASMQQTLTSLANRMTAAETANTSMGSRTDALESFKTTYKAKVDTLESGRTADQARITACEDNRVTDAAAISQLQTRANNVDTQQGANNSKFSSIVTEINTLIDQINDMSQTVYSTSSDPDQLPNFQL